MINYKDNPKLFEATLRENLSSENHTTESLINYGVQTGLELERTTLGLAKCIEENGKLRAQLSLANQFFNMKSWSNDQIREVLENDFGMTGVANLIQKADKSTRKEISKNKIAGRQNTKDKLTFQKCVKDNLNEYKTIAEAVMDLNIKEPFKNYTDDALRVWASEVWTKPKQIGRPKKVPVIK